MKTAWTSFDVIMIALLTFLVGSMAGITVPELFMKTHDVKAVPDRLEPDPKNPIIPVAGFWMDGTLYLSHEDYVRFENLRQTSSYPVKEFER